MEQLVHRQHEAAYAAQTAAAKPHAAVWLFTAFAVFAAFAHDPTPLAWR